MMMYDEVCKYSRRAVPYPLLFFSARLFGWSCQLDEMKPRIAHVPAANGFECVEIK
jgi:hypothetical protein